ncbi:ubiquitin carboxyl-terminal hydrolase [Anthonomus grandis grandis]|uniref:ubiquitin carboxyl-terminal hydrolase n=1 Tax=Anthonomus grandis grandis TaxID=2921223 RepID=UPI0021651872|nr:ubiquitin carboxyl-terminal hydrolase [Anthonomus grandis grandis]
MHLLGVPEQWTIVDVYGIDSDALAWVPRPAIALILLFPYSDKFLEYAKEEAEKIKEKGQVLVDDIFYMKQYVSNACGSMALIHAVANNTDKIELKDGVFKKILKDCKDMTPEERGELLSKVNEDSDAYKLIAAHQELAKEGQTEANPEEKVNHHFVAFVQKGGWLYELDGRKDFPINHGASSEDSFLEDAAKVCKAFMERDADDVNFTIMALVKND